MSSSPDSGVKLPKSVSDMQAEEAELLQDAKYRNYRNQVEKVLRCFETTSEWQDLISSLSKLNRLLQSNTKYPVIPKRIIIGKRLAQCMHPVLPFGVHIKALETYDIIFRCIGKERLALDLFIYSSGLFPLLGHAAMNVKPLLLRIYEDHFIPLAEKLRPGLSGFLVSVLPGVEEGGDCFDQINRLLLDVAEGVGLVYFYGCLWKCVLCNPTVRLPALTFVVSRFDKKRDMVDQMELLGTDRDCAVEAICSCLQDSSILVQRNALDFILASAPLCQSVFSRTDQISLGTSSLVVLLRRDVGLNRRLYQWILGAEAVASETPDPSTAAAEYFKKYSASVVLESLRNLFGYSPAAPTVNFPLTFSVTSPYRILTAFLDRNEISTFILDDILIDVFRSLYLECQTAGKHSQDEQKKLKGNRRIVRHLPEQDIIKAANLFFCNLEQKYLWGFLAKEFKMACDQCQLPEITPDVAPVGSGRPVLLEVCHLLEFLLDVSTLDSYKEAPCEYLPALLYEITQALVHACDKMSMSQLFVSLKLCSKILLKVQPSELMDCETDTGADSPSPTHAPPVQSPTATRTEATQLRDTSGKCVEMLKPATNPTRQEFEKSTTLPAIIGNCFETCQQLFLKLVELRVLENPLEVQALSSVICQRTRDAPDCEVKFSRLLGECLQKDGVNQSQLKAPTSPIELPNIVLHLRADWGPESFKALCSLIVELSRFPVRVRSDLEQVLNSKGGVCDYLPKWLSLMLVLSCFAESADCSLWTLSMTLDLINLSQTPLFSLIGEYDVTESTHSMVNMPMIQPSELRFIKEETRFMQLATTRLWGLLRGEDAVFHLQVADLLQKLHNLAPMCENVLCAALSSDDSETRLEAQKKFSILWHLLRDGAQRPQNTIRYYNRCLLKMLDCLAEESGPHRAISQFWLEHSLSRGDLERILEPILLVLLHPDSARMEISSISIPRQFLEADSGQSQNRLKNNDFELRSLKTDECPHVAKHVHFNLKQKCIKMPVGSTDHQVAHCSHDGVLQLTRRQKRDKEASIDPNHQRQRSAFVTATGSASSLINKFLEPESNSFSKRAGLSTTVEGETPAMMHRTSIEDLETFSHILAKESVESQSRELQNLKGTLRLSDASSTAGAGSISPIVDELLNKAQKRANCQNSGATSEGKAQCLFSGTSEVITKTPDNVTAFNAAKIEKRTVPTHPLHQHILLYTQVYDSDKVLYALQSIKNILDSSGKEALWQMANTLIDGPNSLKRDPAVVSLLERHEGNTDSGAFPADIHHEQTNEIRSFNYLDVLVYLCLRFLRSYYPHVLQAGITEKMVFGNCCVRLLACDVLERLFSMLGGQVQTRERLPSLVQSLLTRCTVQKNLLYCLAACVCPYKKERNIGLFSFEVIDFNDRKTVNFQQQFLATIGDYVDFADVLIPCQQILITTALVALKQHSKFHLQTPWMDLIMTSLPFAVKNACHMVLRFIVQVVQELCRNLDVMTNAAKDQKNGLNYPPDFLITTLENLRNTLRYCLLDEAFYRRNVKQEASTTNPTSAPFLSSLFYAFSSDNQEKDFGHKDSTNPLLVTIRKALLMELPRYFEALLSVWQCMAIEESCERPNPLLSLLGAPRLVKQQIIRCLQTISENYGEPFLSAVGTIWEDKATINSSHQVAYVCSSEQLSMVDLVCQLSQQADTDTERDVNRDQVQFNLTSIVRLMRRILKDPPCTIDERKRSRIEVSILQFLLAYLQEFPNPETLPAALHALTGLWREGLQLSHIPLVIFHLLAILHEFVQKAPLIEHRKDQKDLQDIAQKLIEAIASVASASLEPTTWLRRTLAVKLNVHQDASDQDHVESPDSLKTKSALAENSVSSRARSVQAWIVLAELMASVLDIVYGSEDKDKVVPLLSSVMVFVTPFLRNHSKHNGPSFKACSKLLASFSGYQYTRKAWRKDAFDLLCDPQFFRMDHTCLNHWRSIIDHLMTHDKTTFRDFMVRVSSATQSASLNIFASNEKEYEQRAQLLKRLAYVIFCSEPDQYQKFMPEISERLAENLKLAQVPMIQSQVFLCFRVILLRMSPINVTSMWPGIITELVHACLMMEQELLDAEEQKVAKTIASSHLHSVEYNNSSQTNPANLTLYLSACKLLDMAIALPFDLLPQFQVYRWAFIGDGEPSIDENDAKEFVPHMKRLAFLLNQRFPGNRKRLSYVRGRPMLDATSIMSLIDLQPFFNTLIESHTTNKNYQRSVQLPTLSQRLAHGVQCRKRKEKLADHDEHKTELDFIENIIELDFLEKRIN